MTIWTPEIDVRAVSLHEAFEDAEDDAFVASAKGNVGVQVRYLALDGIDNAAAEFRLSCTEIGRKLLSPAVCRCENGDREACCYHKFHEFHFFLLVIVDLNALLDLVGEASFRFSKLCRHPLSCFGKCE